MSGGTAATLVDRSWLPAGVTTSEPDHARGVLAAVAIGGNVYVYSALDAKEPVVQVVRDVPAGEQITADALRTVDVDADSTVNLVPADRLDALVGSYAKVRLVFRFTRHRRGDTGSTARRPRQCRRSDPGPRRDTFPSACASGCRCVLVVPGGPVRRVTAAPVSIDGQVVGLPTPTDSALGVEIALDRGRPRRRRNRRRRR